MKVIEIDTERHALHALETEIVARAGGPSRAALIAESLHVLPDFIGSRSPLADPGARGGVLGMDLREDAASLQELHVAGLCGLAYGLADIVGKLERAGYEFHAIVVSGGAAQSPLVRQIIADVCGKTVEAPETPEPVLLGSAMIGAVAAGTQTLASAMGSMSAIAVRVAPASGAPVASGRPVANLLASGDQLVKRARAQHRARLLGHDIGAGPRVLVAAFDQQPLRLSPAAGSLQREPADAAAAEQSLQAAIAIAQSQKARSFELRAALSLAKLYRAANRDADAQAVLAPAVEGFPPTQQFPELSEAQTLLSALTR